MHVPEIVAVRVLDDVAVAAALAAAGALPVVASGRQPERVPDELRGQQVRLDEAVAARVERQVRRRRKAADREERPPTRPLASKTQTLDGSTVSVSMDMRHAK